MKNGIDVLIKKHANLLAGKRIGALAHAASLIEDGTHMVDHLMSKRDWKVSALFGPEHGLSTYAQDMEPVDCSMDPSSGMPIYSLYGPTFASLIPTKEMLDGIDCLVIDLQDIGSRYYTYNWTAVLCLKACAQHGKPVILCDRPNPIGGVKFEGGAIEGGFDSFVGLVSVPVRHGMTTGEIVQMVNIKEKIGADLTLIKMEGWDRSMVWKDTQQEWIDPSPNMRSFNAALLYPGMCLLEGTNISEGRGTRAPFEIVGAPYIDAEGFKKEFDALCLPGVAAEIFPFQPKRQKWEGKGCNGFKWAITDQDAFRPYLTGLAFIWLMNKLYKGKGFEWRRAPYEFVTDKPAIDLLTGSAKYRTEIDTLKFEDLVKMAETPKDMIEEREKYLLY